MPDHTETERQAQRDAWDGEDRRQAGNSKLRHAITICSWCRIYLGGYGDSAVMMNHGMCLPCSGKWIREAEAEAENESPAGGER